jgi:hypothetical protein
VERDYSQDVARRIDIEVEKIMNSCMERAQELLTKHKSILDAIALELVRVETIEREEYEKILTLHGVKPKEKMGEEVYIAPPLHALSVTNNEDASEVPHVPSEETMPFSEVKADEEPRTHKKHKKH